MKSENQTQADEIRLKEIFALIYRRKFLFLILFLSFFSWFFHLKSKAAKNYHLEQGILVRGRNGQIINSEYLLQLKKYFLQKEWIAGEILKRVGRTDLNETEFRKGLRMKYIPFAGIIARKEEVEDGYMFVLQVRVDSLSLGYAVEDRWAEIMEEELARFNQTSGLGLQMTKARQSNLVLSPKGTLPETLFVSTVLSFFLSFGFLIVIELAAKYIRLAKAQSPAGDIRILP